MRELLDTREDVCADVGKKSEGVRKCNETFEWGRIELAGGRPRGGGEVDIDIEYERWWVDVLG